MIKKIIIGLLILMSLVFANLESVFLGKIHDAAPNEHIYTVSIFCNYTLTYKDGRKIIHIADETGNIYNFDIYDKKAMSVKDKEGMRQGLKNIRNTVAHSDNYKLGYIFFRGYEGHFDFNYTNAVISTEDGYEWIIDLSDRKKRRWFIKFLVTGRDLDLSK